MFLKKKEPTEEIQFKELLEKLDKKEKECQNQIDILKGGIERMTFKPIKAEPKTETAIADKKEEPQEIYEVVDKLPIQEIRVYKKEDGTIVHLITVAEALTGIINDK